MSGSSICLLSYFVFLIPLLLIVFYQNCDICYALIVRKRIAATAHRQIFALAKPTGTGFGSKQPASTTPPLSINSKQDGMKSLEAQIQKSIDATKGLRAAMRKLNDPVGFTDLTWTRDAVLQKIQEITWDESAKIRDERHKVMAVPQNMENFMLQLADIILMQTKDNSSILDVGCGDGILLGYIMKQAKATKSNWKTVQYHGIDISSEMIKFSKQNYPKGSTFLHTGFLDFENEIQYSAIVFNECFHYFEDSFTAIQKALTCLEVNGKIIISHPKGYRNVELQRSKNSILVPGCLPNREILTKICDSCNARVDMFPYIDADSYLCVLQKKL